MSAGTIPGFLLRDVVTVEPYQGIGMTGPAFGAAVSLRAHVQESDDLPRSSAKSSVIAPAVNTQRTFKVWLRLGLTVPPGSRVMIRGVATTATKVDVNIGVNAGEPAHLELLCLHATLLATTTVTITRGTPTVDSFGDLVDSATVVAAAVQAAIAEDSQTRNAPADERGGVIETYTIRLPFGSVVYEGDRITDDRTGRKYQVTDVTYANPAVGPALGSDDVIVTARRVAATSAPNT